jgi:hypothetical protein
MLVRTDLRVHPVATAANVSYDPATPITAMNVQDAISQAAAAAIAPQGYNPTIVTFAQSPYTPLATDTVLLVDTTGGAVTITLPLGSSRSGASGYIPLTVKDDKENAAVNAITVNRTAPDTIDGVTTYPLDSNGIAVTFQPKSAGGWDVV